MRKRKFLEVLKRRLVFLDKSKKNKVIEKYSKKIDIKKKKMKETKAVESFNIDLIVKWEYFKYVLNKIPIGMVKFFKRIGELFKSFASKLNFKKKGKIKKKVNEKTKTKSLSKKKVKGKPKLKSLSKENAVIKSKKKDKKDALKDNKLVDKEEEVLAIDVYAKKTMNPNLKIPIRIVLCITVFVISLVLFSLSVLLCMNLIGFLDGIRMYGIIFSIFMLILFISWLMMLIHKYLYGVKLKVKRECVSLIVMLVLLGVGVGVAINDAYKLEEIDNVLEFYTMTNDVNVYKLYDEEFEIKFNQKYDNDYLVKYDNSLDGEVRVEVDYFMNYYDLHSSKTHDSLYISFHKNPRNIISSFIEGLKESKIFNFDELSRYEITIYINEKDKEKVLISL